VEEMKFEATSPTQGDLVCGSGDASFARMNSLVIQIGRSFVPEARGARGNTLATITRPVARD